MHIVRDAHPSEVDRLAAIWHDGWQDAHAAILPVELARVRTLTSFAERLRAALADTRVVGPDGAPLGFTMVKGDELYQLYVSAAARGSGVAAALLTDAEQRLAARGYPLTWLACAIGNQRAARFYEKQGWLRVRTTTIHLDTPTGSFPLDVWRYEKSL